MKICPMEAELFLADEQTDGHTDGYGGAFVAFRNFESESNKNLITSKTKVKLFDTVRVRCNSYSSAFPFFISIIP